MSFTSPPLHSAKSWRWCWGWTAGRKREEKTGGMSSPSNFLKSKISGSYIDSLLWVGLMHPGICILYYCPKRLLPVLLQPGRRLFISKEHPRCNWNVFEVLVLSSRTLSDRRALVTSWSSAWEASPNLKSFLSCQRSLAVARLDTIFNKDSSSS